jgi:hypothetical protein
MPQRPAPRQFQAAQAILPAADGRAKTCAAFVRKTARSAVVGNTAMALPRHANIWRSRSATCRIRLHAPSFLKCAAVLCQTPADVRSDLKTPVHAQVRSLREAAQARPCSSARTQLVRSEQSWLRCINSTMRRRRRYSVSSSAAEKAEAQQLQRCRSQAR